MSRLGVQLGVDDFDVYRSQMLAAQKLAQDTQKAINGFQNVTFGNFKIPKDLSDLPQEATKVANEVAQINQRAANSKKFTDRAAAAEFKNIQADITRSLKFEEKTRVATERDAAAEIAAINKQTLANKLATDKLIQQSSKAIADFEIKEAKRAANELIAEFKAVGRERAAAGGGLRDPRDFSSTAPGLAPNVARARAEREREERSANALAILQGRQPNANTALTGEQRYARINLGRQAADVFTQAASGQGAGLIAIQQGPQIIEAMAQSGIKLQASLATMGPLIGLGAAAGLVAYKITNDIRSEAERRLAAEEKIQGVINKQIIASKEYFDVIKQRSQERANTRAVTEFEGGLRTNIADLEERRKTFELLAYGAFNRGKAGDQQAANDAIIYRENIDAINRQIEKQKELEKAGNQTFNTFNAGWEIWKQGQAAAAAETERTIAKIREMGGVWQSAFRGVFGQSNQGNEFYTFLERSDDATKKLTESLRGLDPALQKVAFGMLQTEQNGQRFQLRLNSSLDAQGLRDRASDFRNNPQAERERLRAQGYSQAFIDARIPDQRKLFQERLDRQFEIVRRANGRTPAELAAADEKIIALAGSDPNALRDDQRIKAAEALERQAERRERRDAEAETRFKELLAYEKRIAESTEKLVGKAADGTKVDLNITTRDETNGSTSTEIRKPGQADTDNDYSFGGFSVLGGSNR